MQIKLVRKLSRIMLVGLCGVFSVPAHADLLFTAPPRESLERGEELYGPLARLLTTELGVKVVYEHPRNWRKYAEKMQKNSYDIVFDGPHFAAWRIKHLGHVPVVRLPGELSFAVIVPRGAKELAIPRDLVKTNTPLCGMPPPQLATIMVLRQFSNPVIQPAIYETLGLQEGYELFRAGKCKAAVFNTKILDKLPAEEKAQFRVLFTTGDALPEQTITVSKRVTESQRAILAALLTRSEGIPATAELLKQFTKQAKNFKPANGQDYPGLETMLEEMWGW